MANPSPLHERFRKDALPSIPYGQQVQLAAHHGSAEIEYAAMRKAVGVMDCPDRGLLRLQGADRLDFLQRMVSNDCATLEPLQPRRCFLLNHQGRIQADLTLIDDGEQTWIDLDVHQAASVAEEFDKMLFGEDAQVADVSAAMHRLSLHGPEADQAAPFIEKPSVFAYRFDQVAGPGLHHWLPADQVAGAWETLMEQAKPLRLKPAGWLAFNIARIEGGRPLFHIDYGPNSLPHETGVLAETVSFTKGCYRGQEVVARMESLGHPAKLLIAFSGTGTRVPVESTPLLATVDGNEEPVGAITSSTFSPRRSGAPIGFGVVKWKHHEPGTPLIAPAEGGRVDLTVCTFDELGSV
ncbi:MAG: glycine cleavage T C-terminal barrel domain-containing protein [Phycisphaeraceae bacterium]|nr:glycine cleavage T C-terminal barrel domain-containing protein [Phycisphaeraceae bacterium]